MRASRIASAQSSRRRSSAPDGAAHHGGGALDRGPRPRRRAATGGNVTTGPGTGVLTGAADHRRATPLGSDATPLGQVVSGIGNGDARVGRARADGARTEHVIATYMHGPVLARNPALADYILAKALRQPPTESEAPDQAAPRASHPPRTATDPELSVWLAGPTREEGRRGEGGGSRGAAGC